MSFTAIAHRSFVRIFGLIALCSLLLAACAAPESPTATTTDTTASTGAAAAAGDGENDCEKVSSDIKLGFDTSLTGGTADLGEGHRKGFKLAIKEYNAKGGYQGKKVQCIVLDDGTKPDNGLANVTRLINQDKVIGLIAFTNTGIAVPAATQINDAKIPLIVPVSTGTKVTAQFTEPGSFIFRVSMPDVSQVATMMEFIKSKGWSKPAILHDVTGYGTLGAEDITAALAKDGQQPVETQSFQIGDTDMTAQLTKAKNAGADVVMTYALAPELANLLKSLDRLGWYPPIVGSWTLAQPDMVKFATKDLVKKFDIYMIQSFTIDRDEVAKAFHEKIVAEYGSNPVPITAAQGYDATTIMLMALDKVGPDPVKMRDAIESTTGFKGVTTAPETPFGPTDHEAIEQKDMFVGTLKEVDGEIRVVKAEQ